MLYVWQIQVVGEVSRWCGIVVWMPNIVHSSTTICVIWTFNVVTAHITSFSADCLTREGGAVGLVAIADLIQAAVDHECCKLGIGVHGIVIRLDTVRVVDGKFGIVRSLNVLINDAIDYLG